MLLSDWDREAVRQSSRRPVAGSKSELGSERRDTSTQVCRLGRPPLLHVGKLKVGKGHAELRARRTMSSVEEIWDQTGDYADLYNMQNHQSPFNSILRVRFFFILSVVDKISIGRVN